MNYRFPFNTRLGRFLDSIEDHKIFGRYVPTARRTLRRLWILSGKSEDWQSFLHVVTPRRAFVIIGSILMFFAGIYTWDKSSEVHHWRLYSDVRRISNLEQIRLDVKQFHLKRGRLPVSLRELQSEGSDPHYVRDDHFYDPDTMAPMEYKYIPPDTYRLCANFRYSSEVVGSQLPDSGMDGPIWKHDAGYHCFDFAVATTGPATDAP